MGPKGGAIDEIYNGIIIFRFFFLTYGIFSRQRKNISILQISKDSFPMSMCMKKDIVYVGDSAAKLHVLDPKQDFEPVKSYKTAHEKSITGVYIDSGCLITSSLDRTVQISSPTDPPQPLTSLHYSNGEIASVSILN